MLKWRYGFILFGTCITFSFSLRIYRGKVVRPTDKMKFPYHLQLLIHDLLFCGASLIAPRWSNMLSVSTCVTYCTCTLFQESSDNSTLPVPQKYLSTCRDTTKQKDHSLWRDVCTWYKGDTNCFRGRKLDSSWTVLQVLQWLSCINKLE